MDGKVIHRIPVDNPGTFNNVKVFAGDNFYAAADASFKNLVWENLLVPEYLFHPNTPTIVSLENKTTIFIKNFN